MDYYLDLAWEQIALGLQSTGDFLFSLLQHLHFLGPALVIFLQAAFTVCVTTFLNKIIVTKRYIVLEKEYYHWFNLRQEAMKCEDREKGRRLARNIDQAELNRAYYDYFFEGLLLGIVRRVIPIFFVFGFINTYYTPAELVRLFGKGYVAQLGGMSGEPLLAGAPFFYFLSLVVCYLLWSLIGWLGKTLQSMPAISQRWQIPEKHRQG